MSPYIKVHDRYTYEELQKIFQDTDVLIVPSIWYETFGYTVLEALSVGVPVILSGTVGARDILEEGAAIIIDDINCEKLYSVVRNLSAEKLAEMNRIIVEKQKIMTVGDMAIRIEEKCYR